MAPRAPSGRGGELRKRVVSAAVLAPAALFAVYLGGPALAALVVLAAAGLGWEWSRLCGFAWPSPSGIALTVLLVLAILVAHGAGVHGPAALALAAVAAAVAALAGLVRAATEARWWAAGLVCLGVPCIALLWLRGEGADYVFWLLCVTWAADIGAYFVGRAVGGPRLAPAISPNKTWSGFCGGMAAAAAVGAAVAVIVGGASAGVAALAALVAALAAVIGDLAESALKRRFGAKDAGTLIPGHGGVLDRLDSLLLAGPTAAAMLALGWRWL